MSAYDAGDRVWATHRFWTMPIGLYSLERLSREDRECGRVPELVMVKLDLRPTGCRPDVRNYWGECRCGDCKVIEERELEVVRVLTYAGDRYRTLVVEDPATGNRYQFAEHEVASCPRK